MLLIVLPFINSVYQFYFYFDGVLALASGGFSAHRKEGELPEEPFKKWWFDLTWYVVSIVICETG